MGDSKTPPPIPIPERKPIDPSIHDTFRPKAERNEKIQFMSRQAYIDTYVDIPNNSPNVVCIMSNHSGTGFLRN